MIAYLMRIFGAKKSAPALGAKANAPASDPRFTGLVDAAQSGWYRQDTDELFKGFRIESSDTVLDFGCGEGIATIFAAQRGAAVIFADSELDKIDSIKARIADTPARSLQAILCENDSLPLPDGCVDKVIAMEVLEHVRDPQITLQELIRVATPGAQFLLSVPDTLSENLQKRIAPAAHFHAPNHVRIFQRDEFDQLVTSAGLIIERKEYTGFYWSLCMCFYWVCQRSLQAPAAGATLDKIVPPYHLLLEQWAATWLTFMRMPESVELKSMLDNLLPKSQIIVARKAGL